VLGHALAQPATRCTAVCLCQSLPACSSSLASRGIRLSPTVAMPSTTGSGPGLKSGKEPRCPGRQRTPCVALPHRRPRRLPPPWPFAASALVWVAVVSAVLQSLSVLLLASGCGSRRLCPVYPAKSHVSLPTWDTAQRVVYSALGFSHSQAPLGAARRDKDGLAARLKQRADYSDARPLASVTTAASSIAKSADSVSRAGVFG
jgi:hypothetical protein